VTLRDREDEGDAVVWSLTRAELKMLRNCSKIELCPREDMVVTRGGYVGVVAQRKGRGGVDEPTRGGRLEDGELRASPPKCEIR